MSVRLVPVAAALSFFAAGGCSNDLPAASFVDKLRVLAVRASPPEVAPGETTALDLLAVEPRVQQLDGGPAAPLTALWLVCALPSGGQAVVPCGVGGGAPMPTVIGTGLTASYTPDANVLGGAASTEILLTVAVADSAAGATACVADIVANGGLPTDPDHCVVSLKRLVVSLSPGQERNHNPTLADFYATSPGGFAETLDDDTGVWLDAPGKDLAEWNIAAHRDEAAAEKKPDGTYEALSVSWFTTAGHLDGGRSLYLPPGCTTPSACASELPETGADTSWFAPTVGEASRVVAADGRVDFWAVIRDDRGGVGWRAGSLTRAP